MKRPEKEEYANEKLYNRNPFKYYEKLDDYYSDLERYCDWLEGNNDWLNKVIRDLRENRKHESKYPF